MTRRIWCGGALGLVLTPVLASTPEAQKILMDSDVVRNPGSAFGVTTTLIEYRAGKQVATSVLAVYSKADPNHGQFRSLIRFMEPARDAGKLMLKNGNDLWFFDPSSNATIRISPQQRLLGQASNGDVVTINLAQEYRATLQKEEDVQDGDRQIRACWWLKLEAADDSAAYPQIDFWVDKHNHRPVKGRFYAASGQLLKTAFYRKYQMQLNAQRPTETIIIDGLDPSWVTVMRYSDYTFRELPESWLQRDYLPRFKPE